MARASPSLRTRLGPRLGAAEDDPPTDPSTGLPEAGFDSGPRQPPVETWPSGTDTAEFLVVLACGLLAGAAFATEPRSATVATPDHNMLEYGNWVQRAVAYAHFVLESEGRASSLALSAAVAGAAAVSVALLIRGGRMGEVRSRATGRGRSDEGVGGSEGGEGGGGDSDCSEDQLPLVVFTASFGAMLYFVTHSDYSPLAHVVADHVLHPNLVDDPSPRIPIRPAAA